MSPRKIMAETLLVLDEASSAQRKTSTMRGDFRRRIIVGVEVAKQAVQQLAARAADSARTQEPAKTMKGRCFQLEQEMEALKIQMEIIQRDRDSLREEGKILRKEIWKELFLAIKRQDEKSMGKLADLRAPLLWARVLLVS